MRKVEAIIRHEKFEEVKKALSDIGIRGITVTDVKGCGKQRGYTETYRGRKLVITLRPKLKLEMVAKDDAIDEIVETVRRVARTGEIGDGKIFVLPVENAVAIRTGESGPTAL
jgi:nitrogen regulatory protein P-II 1